MNQSVELFKVLSDETRLRLVNLLYHQDLCVCELVEIMELPQPKISKHMARLRQINMVNTNRNEQWIYYSFDHNNELIESIVSTTLKHIEVLDIIQKDLERLHNTENFICSRV